MKPYEEWLEGVGADALRAMLGGSRWRVVPAERLRAMALEEPWAREAVEESWRIEAAAEAAVEAMSPGEAARLRRRYGLS